MLAQVGLGGAIVDQAPRLVVDEEQLENPGAALIARERAGLAAARCEQGDVRSAPATVLEQIPLGAIGLVRAPAHRAQAPHQPLGEHAEQARCHQERLDAHVDQAHHRARRVVGVEGREHQVAGQARLHRDLRGLQVADLARAKVSSMRGFTWVWPTPSRSYSIGSSTVTILVRLASSWPSAA